MPILRRRVTFQTSSPSWRLRRRRRSPSHQHNCTRSQPPLAQYTREHKKSAMRYVTRMPAEFALLYVMDVRRGGYDIRTDEAKCGKWIGEHSKLFETGVGA